MSGGSYDYLYLKEVSELFNEKGSLESMADFLNLNGYKDVALDMRRLVEYIKSAEIRIYVLHEQLRDVMKAVEWYESYDISKESLEKRIEEYRRGGSHNDG